MMVNAVFGFILIIVTVCNVPASDASAFGVEPMPNGLPEKLHTVPVRNPLEAMKSFDTANGYRVYFQREKQTSKLILSVIYGVGTSHDALKTRILAQMLTKGTEHDSRYKYAHKLALYGSKLDVVAGTHFTTVTLEVPDSNFEPAIKLVNDLLFHPELSEMALEDAVKELKVVAKAQQYSAGYLASMLSQRLLFGVDHPWVTQWFDKELLGKQTVEEVKSYYKKNYLQKPLAISVVGSIDRVSLKLMLEKQLAQWPVAANTFSTVKINLPFQSNDGKDKKIHLIDIPKSQQVEVRAGLVTVSMFHKDWPALFVLADILGGSTGRLYNDLREKRGLTYGAYSRQNMNQNIDGYFEIYGSTKTHNIAEFMQGVLKHWQLLSGTLNKEELSRSKSKLLGAYRINRYKNHFIKASLDDFVKTGVPMNINEALYQAVSKLKLEDVRDVARRYTAQPLYWVVAGDGKEMGKNLKPVFKEYKVISHDRELN